MCIFACNQCDHEAETEKLLKMHKALAHVKGFVCLECETEKYPKSIGGIKAHYLDLHTTTYLADKHNFDNQFKRMKNAWEKAQEEAKQARETAAAARAGKT